MTSSEHAIASDSLRPAAVCARLMAAIEATEGRRRKRKRNTTPDALGLSIKRELVEAIVAADPDPEAFEEWLVEHCLRSGLASGPIRAMALEVLDEYHVALKAESLRDWLDRGAPSDDARRTRR